MKRFSNDESVCAQCGTPEGVQHAPGCSDNPFNARSRCMLTAREADKVTCCPDNAAGYHCNCDPCGKCRATDVFTGTFDHPQPDANAVPGRTLAAAYGYDAATAESLSIRVSGVELKEGKVTGDRIAEPRAWRMRSDTEMRALTREQMMLKPNHVREGHLVHTSAGKELDDLAEIYGVKRKDVVRRAAIERLYIDFKISPPDPALNPDGHPYGSPEWLKSRVEEEILGAFKGDIIENSESGQARLAKVIDAKLAEFEAAGIIAAPYAGKSLDELNDGKPVDLGKVVGVFDTGKGWTTHGSCDSCGLAFTVDSEAVCFRCARCRTIHNLTPLGELLDAGPVKQRFGDRPAFSPREMQEKTDASVERLLENNHYVLKSVIDKLAKASGYEERRMCPDEVVEHAVETLGKLSADAQRSWDEAQDADRRALDAQHERAAEVKKRCEIGDKAGILAGRLKRQLVRNALLRERLEELEGK